MVICARPSIFSMEDHRWNTRRALHRCLYAPRLTDLDVDARGGGRQGAQHLYALGPHRIVTLHHRASMYDIMDAHIWTYGCAVCLVYMHYWNVACEYPIQDINLVQAGPVSRSDSIFTGLARMVYFFRGIADPDAIGKSVVSDNYSLVIQRRNRSPHLDARAS